MLRLKTRRVSVLNFNLHKNSNSDREVPRKATDVESQTIRTGSRHVSEDTKALWQSKDAKKTNKDTEADTEAVKHVSFSEDAVKK